MQRIFWNVLAIALLISPAAHGQSLGDAARENRDKKQAEDAAGVQPRMITNKDLPKDPNPDQAPHPAQSAASAPPSSQPTDQRSAQQRLAEERAAARWRKQILAQENRIVTLQEQIDQLHASMQSASGSVQSEGPYNRYQARELRRVTQLQQRLDEQKRKLDQMQEAARRAGMHTPVYDP